MIEDASNILSLILSLQNVCDDCSKDEKQLKLLSVKFKILFLIYKNQQVSPSNLVELLQMAKSNVALFCKQLLKEQLLISKQDSLDHRIIYYCLTKKGQNIVEKNLDNFDKFICCGLSAEKIDKIKKEIEKVNTTIKKLGENNVKVI